MEWRQLVIAASAAAGAPRPEARGIRHARAAVIDRALEAVGRTVHGDAEVARAALDLAAALRHGRDRLLYDG